jgi:hypothetical protein
LKSLVLRVHSCSVSSRSVARSAASAKPRRIVSRVDCTASGEDCAISVASAVAAVRTSANGTRTSAMPIATASSPVTRRPV